jgi:hypothetical protein
MPPSSIFYYITAGSNYFLQTALHLDSIFSFQVYKGRNIMVRRNF